MSIPRSDFRGVEQVSRRMQTLDNGKLDPLSGSAQEKRERS